MTQDQKTALALIIRVVVDTIKEAGEAPGGILYAALMQFGCSKSQFDSLMAGLVSLGVVTVDESHVYRMSVQS